MKNCKSLVALLLALVMVFSLSLASAETFRFEAEYGTTTGSVPGFIGVFFGASNKCMLTKFDELSNGYAVTNMYNEGNDDDIPELTFTIVSDKETTAQVKLCVGPAWEFDSSFNTVYSDVVADEAYPLMLNGEALVCKTVVSAENAETVMVDDENGTLSPTCYTVADFGTVTLKAGENVFTIKGTAGSRFIDYLELDADAALTWEEAHISTYRMYDEDEMEYVEVPVE